MEKEKPSMDELFSRVKDKMKIESDKKKGPKKKFKRNEMERSSLTEGQTPGFQRATFIVRIEYMEELRRISKECGRTMKEILDELLKGFIRQYRRKK